MLYDIFKRCDTVTRVVMFYLLLCFSLINLSFASSATVDQNHEQFAGDWLTFDGVYAKPRSVVRFTQHGKYLTGKIIAVYPNKRHPNLICHACHGHLRNLPLLGLPILHASIASGEHRQLRCRVLDIDNGHHYPCILQLTKNNQILALHAYWLFPWLGRTVHWHRASTVRRES